MAVTICKAAVNPALQHCQRLSVTSHTAKTVPVVASKTANFPKLEPQYWKASISNTAVPFKQRSAFQGKRLMIPPLKREFCAPNDAIQANAMAADGVHMEPGGLVVLEEETTLTQEEWEEAKQNVRQKKNMEQWVERMIFNCRFFTLAGVVGSLIGSLLCFLKGSYYVAKAVEGYVMLLMVRHDHKVVLRLIEALDTYLVGTVMLIFGMGLYELFVMKLEAPGDVDHHSSSLFGLFRLQERPTWLAISGLDDLKTKLGHVIVMILLVGMFEKSKKVHPTCSMDLFLTAGAVLMCAASLYLLSRLHHH